MILNGAGMDSTLLKVIKYKHTRDESMKWFPMADGSWEASDRTEINDHDYCEITAHGRLDYIRDLIAQLQGNRDADGVLTLTETAAPLFGHDVDYAQPLSAVLSKLGVMKQTSLNGFRLELEFTLGTASYKEHPLALPPLKYLEYSYKGGEESAHQVAETYTNVTSGGGILITDSGWSRGIFEGTFKFSYENIGQLQNFKRLHRSLPFDLPAISGVQYPFGEAGGDTGLRAKLKKVGRISRLSPDWFGVELTFVQDF